jgi:hypothetical protein
MQVIGVEKGIVATFARTGAGKDAIAASSARMVGLPPGESL